MTLKSFAYYDLIEMCGQAGCPVCRLLARDVARLLESILYEYATDRGMQARFRASRGLCADHGHQLLGNNNALAVAVLYEQALHETLTLIERPTSGERLKRGLGRLLGGERSGPTLATALDPTASCLACETRAENEAMHIRALADDYADAALRDALGASDGLCLPHFRMTLRQMADPQHVESLTALQHGIWTRLRAELNEFMRKSDSNHADEAMGSEATSWQRVVASITGDRPR